jgi:NADH-quinone oxidoreductase subunit M
VAHGFLAALSFGLSGYLYHQTKTLDLGQMGGLLHRLPFIGTAFIMAMLAGCGLPGFANFVGEIMVFFGSWTVFPLTTVIAVWAALVVGGVYMIRAIRQLLHGPLPERWAHLTDTANAWRKLPFVLLLGCLIGFGAFPSALTRRIEPAITPMVSGFNHPALVELTTPARPGTAELLMGTVAAEESGP